MGESNKSKLKRKLHIAVFAGNSYEQLFSIRITPITAFTTIGILAILLICGIIMLIAFTGLREYIPGYPTGEERRMIVANLHRSDSLITEIKKRDAMIINIRDVLTGDLPLEAYYQDSVSAPLNKVQNITFEKSDADSIFRAQIESDEAFNVSPSNSTTPTSTDLELIYLYPPLKGIITNKFGEGIGHFGIDVVAEEGSRVSSILDGTVIFAEWTLETGFVIQVQHDNQLVSIYKHNSKLLKRVGARVAIGEAIALVGNSGELSTGPHLHFELWHAGLPLDPENYIIFN